MAKEKLKKFNEYTSRLLPHETAYLTEVFTIDDPERLSILEIVKHNSIQTADRMAFDVSLDKRKYSRLLQWIQSELDKIDVDQKMSWIIQTRQNILLDNVSIELEKRILKEIKKANISDFNFLLFYEMLIQYRHYLIIRMRYQDHQLVHDFIEKYQFDYKSSKLIFEQLHQATFDIIGGGGDIKHEAIQWGNWLKENFNNKRLDGLSRHMSAVRYIFICIRYGMIEDLRKMLEDLDAFFVKGSNYSKRLLVNFYSNMMVYHDLIRDYENAKYYGCLSIKYVYQDTTIYYNNLVNVLLKMGNYEEALEAIETAHFKVANTKNMHSAIGFISNNVRCLSKLGRHQEAITKGRVFLKAYQKQILKYRWHRFFSAYHGALLSQQKYREIIKNTEQFGLHLKEDQPNVTSNKSQVLNIYYQLALYNSRPSFRQSAKYKLNDMSISPEEDYDNELIQLVREVLNQEIN